MKADVLIVGGGVIGLSIARELDRRGVGSIAVLERGLLGNESSNAAAGMLAVQAETDCADAFFDFCRSSNELYPEFASSLLEDTGVDIELDMTGTLYLAFSESDSEEIGHRYAWQTSAGLDVSRLDAAEVLGIEPALSREVREALFFPNDRQVENRKLVAALSTYAVAKGVTIIENCEVSEILVEKGRAAGVRTAATEHFGGTVILASGAWTSLIGCPLRTLPEITPVKGEIVSFGTERGLVSHVVYSPRGYLVPRSDGRILAGSTSEQVGFDKSTSAAAEAYISETAFEIAPRLRDLEIKDRWAGLRPHGPNGRPLIGKVGHADNLLVAAGHFRNGILLAPATAALVADMVEGKRSEFVDTFSLDAATR